MKTLTRTIAVLVGLNLLISGLARAHNVAEEELRDIAAPEAQEANVATREAEIAVRDVQRQAEIAQRQAAANMRQAGIALAKVESVPVSKEPVLSSVRYSTVSRNQRPFGSSGVGSVLVIPSAQIEMKDLLTINEDAYVMSRIIEAKLQQERISASGGSLLGYDHARALLNVLSHRGRASIQSLYLQDYGVIFLMTLDFPLSPSHQEKQPDKTDTEVEETDRVWRDMRIKLYEPDKTSKYRKDDSAPKYDADKVERFKTAIIESLRHAANIRNLKPEESIVLTITGSGYSAGGAGSPTVLVIRAKKADVDSFAKGDLDLEQFRQRVQMLSYPCLAGGSQRSGTLNRYRLSVPPTAPSN